MPHEGGAVPARLLLLGHQPAVQPPPLPTSPTPPWPWSFPRSRTPLVCHAPLPGPAPDLSPPASSHCWRLRLDLFDWGRLREVPDPGSGTAEDIVSEDYDDKLL